MEPFLAPENGVLGAFLSAETGQFLDTKVGSFGYRFWIHVGSPEFGSGLIPGRQNSQVLGGELGPFLGIRSFFGPAKCTFVVHFWVPKFRLWCFFWLPNFNSFVLVSRLQSVVRRPWAAEHMFLMFWIAAPRGL
jgi:hypothetical protein